MHNKLLSILIFSLFSAHIFADNRSLNFDGVNDYVQIANPANFPTTSFSVEMWIKSDNTSKNGTPLMD